MDLLMKYLRRANRSAGPLITQCMVIWQGETLRFGGRELSLVAALTLVQMENGPESRETFGALIIFIRSYNHRVAVF